MIVRRISRWLFNKPIVQRRLRRALCDWSWKTTITTYGGNAGCTGTVEDTVFYGWRLFELCGWKVSLHAFYNRDAPGIFHSHPYQAWRIVLSGGYFEEVMRHLGDKHYPAVTHHLAWHPGDFGRVPPDYTHRVDTLIPPRWPTSDEIIDENERRPTFTLWVTSKRTHEVIITNLDTHGYTEKINETL